MRRAWRVSHGGDELPAVRRATASRDRRSCPEEWLLGAGCDGGLMQTANALLEVTGVSFAYDRTRMVLDNVSVSLRRGTILGLLGPNGSGKTTLLRLLSGTIVPARGRITIDGTPLQALPRRALARRIAVVPQETHSAFDFSALEIVLMGRYPHLSALELEGAADLGIAREAMRATGTDTFASRPFATLSGGEK